MKRMNKFEFLYEIRSQKIIVSRKFIRYYKIKIVANLLRMKLYVEKYIGNTKVKNKKFQRSVQYDT